MYASYNVVVGCEREFWRTVVTVFLGLENPFDSGAIVAKIKGRGRLAT
jgi:hypothetical protein